MQIAFNAFNQFLVITRLIDSGNGFVRPECTVFRKLKSRFKNKQMKQQYELPTYIIVRLTLPTYLGILT